jgi:hypothetical protein
VLKRGWGPLLLLQLCGLVPAALVLGGLAVWLAPDLRALTDLFADLQRGVQAPPPPNVSIGRIILAGSIGIPAMYLISSTVSLATAHLAAVVAVGGTPSIGRSLLAGFKRIHALIGWGLLAVPLTLVALVLCILPVFYVMAVLLVLPAVILFERGTGIGRCFQLFHADLGGAIARVATVAGVSFGVAMVLQMMQGLLSSLVNPGVPAGFTPSTIAISVVGTLISQVVSGLLLTPMTMLTYADLRARTEMFNAADLQLRPAG